MADPETRTGLVFDVERWLPVPPEQVFRAWTDPEEMRGWFAPDPSMSVEADVDLRVGGRYRLRMGTHIVSGTYVAVERPRRLVFSWRWEGDEDVGEMLVTVEMEAGTDGGTALRLRHERLPDEDQRDNHAQGWHACLARLEEHLGR